MKDRNHIRKLLQEKEVRQKFVPFLSKHPMRNFMMNLLVPLSYSALFALVMIESVSDNFYETLITIIIIIFFSYDSPMSLDNY